LFLPCWGIEPACLTISARWLRMSESYIPPASQVVAIGFSLGGIAGLDEWLPKVYHRLQGAGMQRRKKQ
jgi:chemotaxis response regulator CheB